MGKRKIIIILCMAFVLSLYLYSDYKNNQLKVDEEDLSLIIPDKKCFIIEKELLSKVDHLIFIINEDLKDGYSLGLGSPSLSKDGVKKIYQFLKNEHICVGDEQGYFDLENKDIFENFWNNYLRNENSSFIYYEILQTGNIRRLEYCYSENMFYVIMSELNIDDPNRPIVKDIYGRQIDKAYYDKYGFFYYKLLISDLMKSFGIIEYEYIRIEPLGEKNRAYKQKYISTIDYQCTNIFTQNWNMDSIDKINFSDVYEYLYELKNDRPFYADETTSTLDPFIKEIPASSFENLIQDYFEISSKQLKRSCQYDQEKDAYLWNEAYCVPSKFVTPAFYGEVVDIKENKNVLVLTVYVNGYEFGYAEGFTHKIYIQKTENGFHYIKNEVIETLHDHLPQYSPGVVCQSSLSESHDDY